MKLKTQTPKKVLNKAFLKQRPLRSEIETFKYNLLKLLNNIDEIEREENQKAHVRDFLRDTYYKESNEINTKDSKDLVIHLGKTNKDNVGVIIEAKRPSNKGEMITAEKPNVKAFHELVLYYLRERIDEKNIDVKYLIVTNIYEWFIIEASYFESLFVKNSSFKKQYEEWHDGKKINKKTDLFYNEIAKPFIENLDEKIPCVYFDLRDYRTFLENDDLEDDKKLIELYKILSTYHLLKEPFAEDSNALNKPFYDELLHIIGLEEVKVKSKSIIRRKLEGNRDQGSLIENAITILKTEDSLHKVENIADYGKDKEERYYNVALELCIIWINRILFLKLLEAQLVNYHKGNKEFKFLNIDTVPDFGELYRLFHQVLAKTFEDRSEPIREKYKRVPYLNSSLFEFSDLEEQAVKINTLNDRETLAFNRTTILKKFKAENKTLTTLEYLFKFLDAYDFASEGFEDVQDDNRSLINASVLGKVFEKINGYKDGSIFTPGFITMYMCRQAIRLAVIQKFKDKYGWNIFEFEDIGNYLKDRRSKKETLEFNELINSLHLCDPAVGSGHFLVSSLNEIIAIKCELGILADEKGVRLSEYEIMIENDELILTDERGDIFEYQINEDGKPTAKAQRLQKTLFHEKQTLIENCLFGVDINPNSVKICRLRLWIELLKNAYYRESSNYTDLETLPNIDINIKEGNSLLSRFSLDEDLKEVLKNKKNIITDYRNAVAEYKRSRNRDKKRDLLKIIDEIKSDFKTEIYKHHPKIVDLAKKERRLFELNSPSLFEKYSEGEREKLSANLEKQIKKLNQEIEDIKSNAIYKNAFEWRFEFPEVLDDEGNFLGFDIIIGNPPYIALQKMRNEQKAFETQKYQTYSKSSDIYCLFYEKGIQILKEKGLLTYITSNSWLRTQYGELLRSYLVENTNPIELVNIEDSQVFDEVTVESNLILLAKENWTQNLQAVSLRNDFDLSTSIENYLKENAIQIKELPKNGWTIGSELEGQIKEKIEKGSIKLFENGNQIYRGVTTGFNKGFYIDEETRNKLIEEDKSSELIIKPALRGKDVQHYSYTYDDLYLIFTRKGIDINSFPAIKSHLSNYKTFLEPKPIDFVGNEWFGRKSGTYEWFEIQDNTAYYKEFDKDKIIWGEIADKPKFCFDNKQFYGDATLFILTGKSLKYLLSILNSKLSEWYFNQISTTTGMGTNRWKKYKIEQLPIKKIEEKEQKPFIKLVDEILEKKKLGQETEDLENKIDAMVYRLYDLTDEEIAIVKGKEK